MGSVDPKTSKIDVLIVGGGPVGLITACQLAKFLPSTTIRIIEQHPKATQSSYGRAITLYPRSCELLDQLGLASDLAQSCFACRRTASYDSTGRPVHGRGWAFMEAMTDTTWSFALVLRQKHQEAVFRKHLAAAGASLESPVALTAISFLPSPDPDGYRVFATLLHTTTGATELVRCKYVLGADGGHSFVRRTLDIPFDGRSTADKWVRIDGPVRSNLPTPRAYVALESRTHGNVLWAPLDHGATRIGFAFTAERQRAYEGREFDEEAALAEAIEAVKPFELEFEGVDWWTIYGVGQRVAREFSVGKAVFLIGDAAHTHSSGAAQGLNTGIHDAVNLAWKLALVLRGIAAEGILETYQGERQPNVRKLIAYDRDIAKLMTGELPEEWTGDKDADPNEVLGRVMEEAGAFSSGLGIELGENLFNVKGAEETEGVPGPGQRAPDVKLLKPGTLETTRLQTETPNQCRFYVVVFAGDTSLTCSSSTAPIPQLLAGLSHSPLLNHPRAPISFLTLPAATGPSVFELLGGTEAVGRAFFDEGGDAHRRYGIDIARGGVLVLRPDGWIGMSVRSVDGEEDLVKRLEGYFEEFLVLG